MHSCLALDLVSRNFIRMHCKRLKHHTPKTILFYTFESVFRILFLYHKEFVRFLGSSENCILPGVLFRCKTLKITISTTHGNIYKLCIVVLYEYQLKLPQTSKTR